MSVVTSLVDVTLHTLEDAVAPAADWFLELLEECANLETATGTEISHTDITTFPETIAKPLITHLKDNISTRFASSGDILSALSIFDPKKVSVDSDYLSHYGEASISTLLAHYGIDRSTDFAGHVDYLSNNISRKSNKILPTVAAFLPKQCIGLT